MCQALIHAPFAHVSTSQKPSQGNTGLHLAPTSKPGRSTQRVSVWDTTAVWVVFCFQGERGKIALVNNFAPAKSFYLARALSIADRAQRLMSNKEAFFPLLLRSLNPLPQLIAAQIKWNDDTGRLKGFILFFLFNAGKRIYHPPERHAIPKNKIVAFHQSLR